MDLVIEGTLAAAEHTESRERILWPKNSIFRAPAHIRSGRESEFEPKLVSIGPYYHGWENLKRMEDLKHRCIKELQQEEAFIVRNHPKPSEVGIPNRRNRTIYNVSIEPSTQGESGIEDIPLEQFMSSGERARAYYKEEFDHNIVEFVRMLVLDSCFIIRIILSLSQQVQENMAFLDVHIKYVKSDLLLLENQIPLFFIKDVYHWLFHHGNSPVVPTFDTVLEPFICLDIPWTINHDAISRGDAAHLLDLYWRCSLSPRMYKKLSAQESNQSDHEGDISDQEGYLSEQEKDLPIDGLSRRPISKLTEYKVHIPIAIANATELHKMAGVEFEKFDYSSHLNVIFSKGIMRMPYLKIDTRQTTMLVNAIAFENCILPSMRNFSCYMKLMDALIDSEQDVKLLHECGVIYNALSSNEMAVAFFNDVGNICFVHNKANRFSRLYKNVDRYYNSIWHRRCASLRQNYFSSPWAAISLFAAGILLILSVLQTFYGIYGYYKP